jgi:hypothetical protein
MANLYYTYIHYNTDNKPIYVGKGKDSRAYEKRNYNEPYTVKIIDKDIPEKQALEFEEFLIEEIGIDNLYNKCKKGCVSGKSITIDYDNYRKEIKRISQLSVKEMKKHLELLVDDAIAGNEKAMLFFVKKCPKDILLKIKDLVYLNSVKFSH